MIPQNDDPTRRFTMRAELRDAASTRSSCSTNPLGTSTRARAAVRVWFEDDIDCGEGRTCSAGRCLGSCFTATDAGSEGRSRPNCEECQRCEGSCAAVSHDLYCWGSNELAPDERGQLGTGPPTWSAQLTGHAVVLAQAPHIRLEESRGARARAKITPIVA